MFRYCTKQTLEEIRRLDEEDKRGIQVLFLNHFYKDYKIYIKIQLESCIRLVETNKMTPKWSNLNIVLGYWNENHESGISFQ